MKSTAADRGGAARHESDLSWLDAALAAGTPAVVLIGSRRGLAVKRLRASHPAVRAVVLEPDPNVGRMLAGGDGRSTASASSGPDGLAVLVGPDYAGAAEVARRFPDLHNAPAVVDPDLAGDRPAEVQRAREALERLAFQTRANDGARRASAGRYLLHTLANVPRIAREGNVQALAGVAAGMPAVIAAAGPSLDRNVHDLWPVRDRAVLIACDTAARPLLAHGLEPDFVVGADPSRANAGHLASLPASRAWLVAEASLHPSAFALFDRRTFVFRLANHQPWPWLASMALDRGHLGTWGSVATSAFSLALLLGCDPIVFVGADFAFTGGRPYCRGTSFEPQWAAWTAGGTAYPAIWQTLVDRWPETTATDLHGQPVRTARHLVSFRDWVAEQAGASGRRIVNATGDGLLFGRGIEQAAAAHALERFASIPADLLHEVLRAAHVASRGTPARALAGIDAVLGDAGAATRDAWMAATAGTVTPAAIEAALRSPEHAAWRAALDTAKDPS